MIRKIFPIISLLIVCALFFYRDISIVLSYVFANPHISLTQKRSISLYNEALLLAQSKKYTEAKALLVPLLSSPDSATLELYGDILVYSSGGVGDILSFYREAYRLQSEPRIAEKIRIFEKNQAQSGSTSPTQSGTQITQPQGQNQDEIQKRIQELNELQYNRK